MAHRTRRRVITSGLAFGGVFLAVLLAYSNHFHNSFHFDDAHTIEGNPYIRDLRNIPKFFTDAATSTTLPQNQIYRPLVSMMLAVDYWLAGGLDPLWYHIDVFFWYLVQLALMYLLFVKTLHSARAFSSDDRELQPGISYLALFAVAWYGLHPAGAETVNYMYQRGDLYSTLGVIAALVVYMWLPRMRRFGLYLAPALVAMFAKQSALMFAPLLFVYILLFEKCGKEVRERSTTQGRKLRKSTTTLPQWRAIYAAAMRSAPAFALCGVYYVFQAKMSPVWTPGGTSRAHYVMTQPIVLAHYFRSFFLPTGLSADTDRALVTTMFSTEFAAGFVFLCAFALAVCYAVKRFELRPVAFGLLWFIIASVPTSVIPLAEVENDHRMFFPFVGLVLAVVSSAALLMEKLRKPFGRSAAARVMPAAVAIIVLASYGYGTHRRNEVWRSEATLWKDVTEKSPRNGRGWMNYGLTFMERADFQGALRNFETALLYTPNYSVLHINLGIAYAGAGDDARAETHFRQARTIAPDQASSHFFYARWLKQKHRIPEAVELLENAVKLNSAYLDARYLLMQIYAEQDDLVKLKSLAEQTMSLFASDRVTSDYLTWANDPDRKPRGPAATSTTSIESLEIAARQDPSPETFLNLSLAYEQAGRHDDCISAARSALKLKPDYAEAYNNIAVGYNGLKNWDAAIQAAQQALKLKPDYSLARNNLNWTLSQRRRHPALH